MKQYQVINFSLGDTPDEQAKRINTMSAKGYRLVSVSDGRAYFESYENVKRDGHGFPIFKA